MEITSNVVAFSKNINFNAFLSTEYFVISKKESNNFVISKKEFNTKGG